MTTGFTEFPKGTPGVYYVKPKSEINPTPLPEFQQPPSQQEVKDHYWSFPINVARFRNYYQSLPDKTQIPEWFNPDAIESAYQYYQSENQDREWWNWKKPDNDPMDQVMSQVPPPPLDFLPEYDQKYSNYTVQDFDQSMAAAQADPNGQIGVLTRDQVAQLPPEIQKTLIETFGDTDKYIVTNQQAQQMASLIPQQQQVPDAAQQIAQLKADGTWDQLGPAQQFLLNLNSSKYGGAVQGGLMAAIPAGMSLLQGPKGIPGALVAMGIGAGGGQIAAGPPNSPVTQVGKLVFAGFQALVETVGRMTGVVAQFAGSAYDPGFYGPLSEILQNFDAAWQASDIGTYGFHPLKNDVVVHQLGKPGFTTLTGEEADTLKQISNLRKELVDVYAGRSPKSFEEVLFGYKEAQPLVDKYIGKYGLEGQARDLVFMIAADPLNFSGVGLSALGEKVATKVGLTGLAKAFASTRYTGGIVDAITKTIEVAKEQGPREVLRSPYVMGYTPTLDGGLVSTIKNYVTEVQKNPNKFSDAEISNTLMNHLTGMVKNENGNWVQKIYLKPADEQKGTLYAIRNMVPFTSVRTGEANLKDTLQSVSDSMAASVSSSDITVDQAYKRIISYADQDPKEMGDVGVGIEGYRAGYELSPGALSGSREPVEALKSVWDATTPQRELVNSIGEGMKDGKRELSPTERLPKILADPETYFNKKIEELTNLAKMGDKVAEEKLKLMEGLTAQDVAQAAETLTKTKVPVEESHIKVEMGKAVLEATKEWGLKWFGVVESPYVFKLADTIKKMESFALLFPNPGFFLNNVFNNNGTGFADGLLGFNNKNKSDAVWQEFGYTPGRAAAGIGVAGEDYTSGHGVNMAGSIIEEVSKVAKGEPLKNPLAPVMRATEKLVKGGFTSASRTAEESASYNIATNAKVITHNRMSRVGVGIDAMEPPKAAQINEVIPGMTDRIYNAINGKRNAAQVDAALSSKQTARVPTAEERELLHNYNVDAVLDDSLLKAGNDPNKIVNAYDEARTLTNSHLSETQKYRIEEEHAKKAELLTQAQGEQVVPVLLQETYDDVTMNQLNHQEILDQVWAGAEKLKGKNRDAYLTKALTDEGARMSRASEAFEAQNVGVARGLGIDPETTGMRVAIHKRTTNLKTFYDEDGKIWGLVSDSLGGDKEKAVASAKKLEAILQKELGDAYDPTGDPIVQARQVVTNKYKVMIANEKEINRQINSEFLNHVLKTDPKSYNGFKEHLNILESNRDMQTAAELYWRTGEDLLTPLGKVGEETKVKIDAITGGLTLDQLRSTDYPAYRKAWKQFQNEVYTPLWYQNLETARDAELTAWKQAKNMAESTPPVVEPSVPANRFVDIDESTAKWDTLSPNDQNAELVRISKLYGIRPEALKNTISKYLGKKLTLKEITPQHIKDYLSSLSDEEFLAKWVNDFPTEGRADMPPNQSPPVVSPEIENVQRLLTHPMYSAQEEEYATLVKMLEDMKADHLSKRNVSTGGVYDEIANAAVAKGLDPTEYVNMAKDYVAQAKRQMQDVNYMSSEIAMKMRDFSLLNYDDRSVFDHNISLVMPYSYWYTHSMMNWAVRALDRPGLMASYAKIKSHLDAVSNGPNQPTRLKGKMFMPFPFLPSWMGKGIYVDPLQQAIPINNFLRPFETWDQNQQTQFKSAVSILQDMVDNQETSFDEAQLAAQTRKGDLWSTAWAKAGTQMDAPTAMDYATMLTAFHMPISWLLKAAEGKSSEIAQLPFTRLVQNLTGAVGIKTSEDKFGGLIGPEGVNLEAWVRKPLGLSRVDKFQDYKIDRELGTMAKERPELADELSKAMIDRNSPFYNEAVSRVMQVNFIRQLGAQVALDFFPEGEKGQRELRSEYAKAAEAYAAGDTTALNKFFDEHPEYQTQQNVWRDPTQRMNMYLRSQIWEAYNAQPDLYKKEIAASFGSLFQNAFLNKETRSYPSIDTNTLASWAKAIGANMPNSVQASQIPLNLSSQKDAQLVQNFNDYKDQNFPNLDKIYEYANSLPADQRDQFLNSQQEVAGFNQMKNSFLAQYPNLADSVNSQSNELMGLPVNIQSAVYNYLAEKDKMFPNIEDIQTQYFSLTDPVQKSAFMLDHPELEKYWNWRGSYAANFPNASPYILSDQNIKGALNGTDFNAEQAFPGIYDTQSEYFSYAKGSPARRLFLSQHPELKMYWDWKGYYGDELKAEAAFAKELTPIIAQMSDELKSNMVGHFSAGQALSSGAMMELKKLYNLNGMGGGLNTFIESLKVGF